MKNMLFFYLFTIILFLENSVMEFNEDRIIENY